MLSRYVITIGNATFHIGEDLMSLVAAFELLVLLILLLCSYSRLNNSFVKNRESKPTLYILPLYFAFVLLLTIWYLIDVLLIVLPNVKDSFALSILYDGHGKLQTKQNKSTNLLIFYLF